MNGRAAWSLLLYALVAGLGIILWIQASEKRVAPVGAGGEPGAEVRPPTLELREKRAASVEDPQAKGASARSREQWRYRVHTNVPGATVTLHVESLVTTPVPGPSAKVADGDGFAGFDLPELDVPFPLVEVSVEAEGYRSMRRRVESPDTHVTLSRAHAVRGRVMGADGTPIENAVLRLEGVAVRSRSDGSFTAFASSTGRLRLSAGHRTHMRRHVFVDVPSRDVVVNFERGTQVEGRVTFPDGSPVAGVPVRVYASLVRAVTRANGTYTLQGLVPGRAFRLGVMGRQHFFSADTRTANLVVREHAVHLELRAPSGKTAKSVYVSAGYVRENGADSRAWGWAKNGRFLARTPVNATVLYAWTAPHIEMGTRHLVTDAEPRAYYLNEVIQPLQARGRIALLAPRGVPDLGGRRLTLMMPTGAAMPGFEDLGFDPDEEGRMLLGPLPPGRFGVDLAGLDEIWTQVRPNEVTEVVLR